MVPYCSRMAIPNNNDANRIIDFLFIRHSTSNQVVFGQHDSVNLVKAEDMVMKTSPQVSPRFVNIVWTVFLRT